MGELHTIKRSWHGGCQAPALQNRSYGTHLLHTLRGGVHQGDRQVELLTHLRQWAHIEAEAVRALATAGAQAGAGLGMLAVAIVGRADTNAAFEPAAARPPEQLLP